LQALKVAIDEVIRYERTARQALLTQGEDFLKDKVWRALALLQSARMIPSEETMMLLSAVRMGINVGLADAADEADKADKAADEDNKPPFPDIKTVNELFILTQPAHLQKMRGQELSEHQRDTFRADYLRQRLN
ncbi:MAG: hypothetical protein QF662_08290, partial [Phycisphaerae bacterium]|nr:hypothetical protein [Phycisphaerae bacterium]